MAFHVELGRIEEHVGSPWNLRAEVMLRKVAGDETQQQHFDLYSVINTEITQRHLGRATYTV